MYNSINMTTNCLMWFIAVCLEHYHADTNSVFFGDENHWCFTNIPIKNVEIAFLHLGFKIPPHM